MSYLQATAWFCLMASVAAAAEPAPPKYEITATRGEIAVADGGKRLEVTSEFGIGRATIKLTEGQWPEKLTFLLKLKELEGLTLRNDKLSLHTSRKSKVVEAREKQGDEWKETKLNPEPKITIRGADFQIEVEVPKVLLGPDVKQIEIEWIDYYRG